MSTPIASQIKSAAKSSDGKAPLVIAHRGASGYLPEHTLAAYAFGYAQGADYVEPDLVMTKDGVLICLHDIHLEGTTDVEERFPDRGRADGRWYAADFTLEEIRTLRAHERLPGRFPGGKSSFHVPTFSEMIELVQGLNESTGRKVGIYPELKAPAWHREQGLAMEKTFLEVVESYGYKGPDAAIFVQCFEAPPLERMREMGSELPQIQLVSGGQASEFLSAEGLERVARYAQGVGPSKTILERDRSIVARAHDAGLALHPYTFRADDVPEEYGSFDEELERFYVELGVDGLFTDFPDAARRFVDAHWE